MPRLTALFVALPAILMAQTPVGAPKASAHRPKRSESPAVPFPLPLPKGYLVPPEVRAVIVSLYKSAPSVVEFRERYKLVYQEKSELTSFLLDDLNRRLGIEIDTGDPSGYTADSERAKVVLGW